MEPDSFLSYILREDRKLGSRVVDISSDGAKWAFK